MVDTIQSLCIPVPLPLAGAGLSHIPCGACGYQFPSRLREGLGVGQSDEIDGFAPNADSPTPNPSRKREGEERVMPSNDWYNTNGPMS